MISIKHNITIATTTLQQQACSWERVVRVGQFSFYMQVINLQKALNASCSTV